MKILLLSTWFPFPPDNGARIRAYYLAKALAREHHLTMVSFRPAQSREAVRPSWVCQDHVTVHSVAADPFRYTHMPRVVRFLAPIPLASWPQRIMERQVTEVAHDQVWDAVVALEMPASHYALKITRAPRVLDMDVSSSHERYSRCRQLAVSAARVHEWVGWQKALRHERHTCRHFAACTVVLEAEVAYLRRILKGTSCEVVASANGVDLERNWLEIAGGAKDGLIYTGALTYDANLDAVEYFVKHIFPLIRQERPEIVLSVTGSTDGVDLGRLPLDPSVRLTGYLPDIRPALRRSAICVIPIRRGTGTRLKALEAMALGTPVVSTSKGIEGLEVVHGRHLLIADDPMDFASCTMRLLTDRALGESLARNARRLVEERYDWNQIGARFVSLVESVVADRRLKSNGAHKKSNRSQLFP